MPEKDCRLGHFLTSRYLEPGLKRLALLPVIREHGLTGSGSDGRVQGVSQGRVEAVASRDAFPAGLGVELHHVFGQELIHFVVRRIEQQEDWKIGGVTLGRRLFTGGRAPQKFHHHPLLPILVAQ